MWCGVRCGAAVAAARRGRCWGMGDLHTRADGSNDDEAGEMSDEVQAWKQLKEQFVSGGTGSSVSHINAVCVTAIVRHLQPRA